MRSVTSDRHEISFVQASLELGGIVFLRFEPLPRMWAAWLVAVNGAAVAFIGHVEAQVALVAVNIAVFAQTLIYQRYRFIRPLGATHVLWAPMLVWFWGRLDHVPAGEVAFRTWMEVLILTNAISLVIDTIDVFRYLRGEREPYYEW